jgi:hypothetical protein
MVKAANISGQALDRFNSMASLKEKYMKRDEGVLL